MKIFLVATILILLTANTALAKPDEPEHLPKWETPECVETIERIVSHETDAMQSEEVFRFMTEQVIYDIERMGCANLTQWRWRIGNYPLRKASNLVRVAVWKTILDYPFHRYARCQFIGYPGDVTVWRSHGYRISVDYRHSVGNLTVIGANCQ